MNAALIGGIAAGLILLILLAYLLANTLKLNRMVSSHDVDLDHLNTEHKHLTERVRKIQASVNADAIPKAVAAPTTGIAGDFRSFVDSSKGAGDEAIPQYEADELRAATMRTNQTRAQGAPPYNPTPPAPPEPAIAVTKPDVPLWLPAARAAAPLPDFTAMTTDFNTAATTGLTQDFEDRYKPTSATIADGIVTRAEDAKLWLIAGGSHAAVLPGGDAIRHWEKFYRSMSGATAKKLLAELYDISPGAQLRIERVAILEHAGGSYRIHTRGALSGIE